MGIQLRDSTADFSAISIGDAGLYTSITTGLLALFEPRRRASKAIKNSAPGGSAGGAVGAPTFSAGSASVSVGNGINFNVAPAGDHTTIIVMKMKTGGTTADMVAGAWGSAPATQGGAYFNLYNYRIAFNATTFAAGSTPPLSGYTQLLAYLDLAAVANFEMVAGIAESGVSARIYQPKTGALFSAAATGRAFIYDNPGFYKTVPLGASAQDVALFAHWNRVLTPTEINTFYAEIQAQLAPSGIVI